MSSAEIVNSAMAFRLPTSLWIVLTRSCSVGQLSLGRSQTRRERAVDHLVAHRDQEPTQQFGVDLRLHRHRMTIDAAEHFGETSALSIAELGCRTDLRDNFTAARHRNLCQKLHGLLGRLTSQ